MINFWSLQQELGVRQLSGVQDEQQHSGSKKWAIFRSGTVREPVTTVKVQLIHEGYFQQVINECRQGAPLWRSVCVMGGKEWILWGGGRYCTEVAFALLIQQPRVCFSAFPRILLTIFFLQIISDVLYQKKYSFLMLLRLINGTSQSVESLNMLIKPSSTSQWQASTTKREWILRVFIRLTNI